MQATNQFTLSDEAIELLRFLLRQHRKGLRALPASKLWSDAQLSDELELTEALLDYIKQAD